MGGDAWWRTPQLFYVLSVSRTAGTRVGKAASILFIVDNTRLGTVQCETRIIIVGHYPPCVYPLYLTSPHETKSLRTSPSVFAYCKWSNTGGGNGLGMRLQYCGPCEFMTMKLKPCLLLDAWPEMLRLSLIGVITSFLQIYVHWLTASQCQPGNQPLYAYAYDPHMKHTAPMQTRKRWDSYYAVMKWTLYSHAPSNTSLVPRSREGGEWPGDEANSNTHLTQ